MSQIDYANLKTWMGAEDITQKQLAANCGYKPPTVNGWINGGKAFPGDAIKSLKDKHRLTPQQIDAFFFGGTLEKDKEDRRTELLLELLQEVTAAISERIQQHKKG